MERITHSNESAVELVTLKSVVVVYYIYCFSFPSLIESAARERSSGKEDYGRARYPLWVYKIQKCVVIRRQAVF